MPLLNDNDIKRDAMLLLNDDDMKTEKIDGVILICHHPADLCTARLMEIYIMH